MENMVLQATELGIASCIVSRGYETFSSEEGRKIMKEWEVPQGYECQGFVILGYKDIVGHEKCKLIHDLIPFDQYNITNCFFELSVGN